MYKLDMGGIYLQRRLPSDQHCISVFLYFVWAVQPMLSWVMMTYEDSASKQPLGTSVESFWPSNFLSVSKRHNSPFPHFGTIEKDPFGEFRIVLVSIIIHSC
jgi:hypothetical protein